MTAERPNKDRLWQAAAGAIHDRRHSWHARGRPPENSSPEEIVATLADVGTWADILALETADSFDARAANGRIYRLTVLPIRSFAIRYYAVMCFAPHARGLWHSRIGADYLSCTSQDSLFLGRVKNNSTAYRSWHLEQRSRYVLKFDIKAFYPSIRHEILLLQLTSACQGGDEEVQRMLGLLPTILAYSHREAVSGEVHRCEVGLPIGNTTERFFSNLYLDSLDEYLIEQPDIASSRRLDDIRVFADDPDRLHVIREHLAAKLDLLGLRENTAKTKILEIRSSNR